MVLVLDLHNVTGWKLESGTDSVLLASQRKLFSLLTPLFLLTRSGKLLRDRSGVLRSFLKLMDKLN